VAICLSGAEESEIPWQFRDPMTRKVARLLVRLEPRPEQHLVPDNDPLFVAMRAWHASLPYWLKEDYVALVEKLIDTAEAMGLDSNDHAILAHIAEQADAEEKRRQDARTPPWKRWALRVVEAEVIPSERLNGYTLGEDKERKKQDEEVLRLLLSKGARRFHFRLRETDETERPWLRGQRFEVVHDEDSPPQGPTEEKLARLVLRLLDTRAP